MESTHDTIQQPTQTNNLETTQIDTTTMPRKKRASKSRREAYEQKQIMKQTLLLIGGAIVLILVFLLVLLPGVIRLAGSMSNVTIVPEDNTLPPQVPSYGAPPSSTNEKILKLTGYAQPEVKILLLHNEKQTQETMVDENGTFTIDVELKEGKNALALYAQNFDGKESTQGKTYQVYYDAEPPTVEIIEPEEGEVITKLTEKNITIKGTTEPESKVYINGRLTSTNQDGEFQSNVVLTQGENTIKIRVIDKGGNEVETERKVTFSP